MIVIDDCYQGLKNSPSSQSSSPCLLLSETLSRAGVAILLTSFTSIAAFVVGAFTDIPAVVYFCRNAALSFTWCFVLNVTLFPALLAIDEGRRAGGWRAG
jgi:predicted RND superfamily exporter protein